MAKKRHHFVPKLYLRSFSSSSRRIHLLHLTSGRTVRDASLRDQCYAHRFYGKTDEIEDKLAIIEGEAASVVHEICDKAAPPVFGSEAHAALLVFVGLQLLRTPTARQQIRDSFRKVDEQVFGDYEPAEDAPVQPFGPIDDAHLLRLQLGHLPKVVEALDDLALHVATAPSSTRLVTSDNPFVKYNSYLRGIRYWGSLGAACRGLQIFVPLSPRVLLVLFDALVYDVAPMATSSLRKNEVKKVNALQLANAEQCVYFSHWEDAEGIQREAKIHRPGKRGDRVQINEGPIVGREDDSSIVHTWEQMPGLQVSLPFSRLRLKARRVPLRKRVNTYRRPLE